MKKLRGFTLVEIIIAVSLLGVLAAFAIPNYNKSVNKARYKTAWNNMLAIHAAEEAYEADTGEYWPSSVGTQNLSQINTTLGLSIIADGVTYTCDPNLLSNPAGYSCQAAGPGNIFRINLTHQPINLFNPTCVGQCP